MENSSEGFNPSDKNKRTFLRSNLEDYLEKRTASIKSNEKHSKNRFQNLFIMCYRFLISAVLI